MISFKNVSVTPLKSGFSGCGAPRERKKMKDAGVDDDDDNDDKNENDNKQARGAIVVVAKCPIPGKCKTRLGPFLGEEGAARLARAMLSDVLVTLSESSQLDGVLKVLLYAPGNNEGCNIMRNILQSLKLDNYNNNNNKWTLLPMLMSTDLLSCNLGTILADALQRTRALLLLRNNNNNSHHFHETTTSNTNDNVLFLGMDAPELPMEEIITALTVVTRPPTTSPTTCALLCPTSDGGYGLLSIPSYAPCPDIFQNIGWSQSLTALSQLKALTDANVRVQLGRLMHDIDEPDDVKTLAQRLLSHRNRPTEQINESNEEGNNHHTNNVLWTSSSLSCQHHHHHSMVLSTTTGTNNAIVCEHTWNALLSIGLIMECKQEEEVGGVEDEHGRVIVLLSSSKYAIREDFTFAPDSVGP